MRDTQEDQLMSIIQPKTDLLTYHQKYDDHSCLCLPNTTVYPHSLDLHEVAPVQIIEALPESRWYRKSKTKSNTTIVIENPHMDPLSDDPKHQRTTVQNFWTLINWHKLTSQDARPLKEYDDRAHDIWQAIKEAKDTSGSPSLCWATLRSLLDILIDEVGCDTELFSNILNTYFRFKARRICYKQMNHLLPRQTYP